MIKRKEVTILDYGLGNLLSVKRAFEESGAKAIISDDPLKIKKASYLILPGVGNFAVAVRELQKRNLFEPLSYFATLNRPLLGICLGMQLLFESSDEQGFHEGLGFIRGKVKAIPKKNSSGIANKIPHIGWAAIEINKNLNQSSLFSKKSDGKFFYFVHSFQGLPSNNDNYLATTSYNDIPITAAVVKDSIIGCQFHPEKSGKNGLELIENFLNL